MSTVIAVENLSKRYILSHKLQKSHITLRENLAEAFKKSIYRNETKESGRWEEFWALQNINFEIQQGDRVGIIGRNGAGKSTLLKILSRITQPTTGKITLRGNVASLLEVGTGFHPELTGRENIFLNGAILGMSKNFIKQMFDEIVAFAEVEKFLDTPVKRYSSGMYVRLAFAVAAHLETDILIVDEVLAVGDAQFQKKCMGKMESIGDQGRTVLFVSHNLNAIQQLCTRAISLQGGLIADFGPIDKVLESYLTNVTNIDGNSVNNIPRAQKEYGATARIIDAWPIAENLERISGFKMGETIAFKILVRAGEDLDNIFIVAGLETALEYRLTTVMSGEESCFYSLKQNSELVVKLTFPTLRLKPGTYYLTLGIRKNRNTLDHVPKAIHFDVSEISVNQIYRESHLLGDVLAPSEWNRIL